MIYNEYELEVPPIEDSYDPLPNALADLFLIDQNFKTANFILRTSSVLCSSAPQNDLYQPQKPMIAPETASRHSNSPYHNFQKHLIIVLKKFIHIGKTNLPNASTAPLAMHIWHNFLQSRVHTKKVLHLVFGSAETNNTIGIQSKPKSQELSSFKLILSRHPRVDISSAQSMLRERVAIQGLTMSKSFLKSNCNICRFQEFYFYFQTFLRELEKGPLSSRMTKSIKLRLSTQRPQHSQALS